MLKVFSRIGLLWLPKPIVSRQAYAFAAEKIHMPTFSSFPLMSPIHDYLNAKQYHTPSSIQQKVLANYGLHHNYYMVAPTGSGKTLAYLLPIFDQLKKQEMEEGRKLTQPNRPRCLILVSSKELVSQVTEVAKELSHHCKMKVAGLAHSIKRETQILNSGVDIVVSTIDRFQRLRDHLFLSNVSHLVIDELDTLLDNNFTEQLTSILEAVKGRQLKNRDYGQQIPKVMLVSATFTPIIGNFFDRTFKYYQRDPKFYKEQDWDRLEELEKVQTSKKDPEFELKKIVDKNTHLNLQNIRHQFIHCSSQDKHEPLYSLLMQHKNKPVMVFCNTVNSLHQLQYYLNSRAIDIVSLHGNLPRPTRQANLDKFKGKAVKILLSTDLGSRGLDFPFLQVVINYDFPATTSDYLHRAGRTGRAGRQGTVYTLYHNKNLKAINELKQSNDSKKPLDVKRSAYSLINREEFKHLRQTKTAKVDKAKQQRAKRAKPHKTVRFRQKIKVKRRNKD